MRILITGGLGFVGGRLTKRLSEEHEVIVSSRHMPERKILKLHGHVSVIEHQKLLMENEFPKSVDAVIHLAALNEWDSVDHPSEAIRVNVDETRIILENSIRSGVGQFIYFSTAHIYGALSGTITEETLPVPTHPYAITHKAAEDYVVAATLQGKINGIVLRLSNAFGAPVSPTVNRWTLLANDLCRQAVEKNELTLLSNGLQQRDFICLTDVEEVIARIISKNYTSKKTIYNLGSGISMRVLDMAHMIIQLSVTVLKKNIPLKTPTNNNHHKENYQNPKHPPDPTNPSPNPSPLMYSVDRLLSSGFTIANDTTLELERLLEYCAENFSIHA